MHVSITWEETANARLVLVVTSLRVVLRSISLSLTMSHLLERYLMPFALRRYSPAFIIVVGFLCVTCVARPADDPSRHRQVEANIRLPAVPPLAGKLTADPHEQAFHPGHAVPDDPTDRHSVQRGKVLFHDKAACFECHGQNGDLNQVSHSRYTTLAPPPTDLRTPTDKSVRQLYLILRYGIPGTEMASLHRPTTLLARDILDLIAYVLDLQGTARSLDALASQTVRPDTETDVAISTMCEQEEIGAFDRKEHCEDRYAKRYLNLIVGRPPDISPARYAEIESGCKQRAAKDLDTLELCYRAEYTASRPVRHDH